MRRALTLQVTLCVLCAGVAHAADDTVITIGRAPTPIAEPEEQVDTAPELPAPSLTFDWPLPVAAVNSLFGARTDPMHRRRTQFHLGVDLEANYGAVIHASAPGVVVRAGWHHGHGREVVIEHAGGYRTCYAHMSQVIVLRGEAVRQGQAIGLVGNSGRSTGPHLHFELQKHGVAQDPLDLLGETVPLK